MPKIEELEGGRLLFICPGCDMYHNVFYGQGTGPRWTWNGSLEAPTFSPSVLVRYDHWTPVGVSHDQQTQVNDVCHSFITDGKIQFLGDCTHKMAGQTVDLPEMD